MVAFPGRAIGMLVFVKPLGYLGATVWVQQSSGWTMRHIPVHIHTSPANGLVAVVLLDRRLAPASERAEVGKACRAIVVGV